VMSNREIRVFMDERGFAKEGKKGRQDEAGVAKRRCRCGMTVAWPCRRWAFDE